MSATISIRKDNIEHPSAKSQSIIMLVEDDSDDSALIGKIITEVSSFYSIITIDKGDTVLSGLSRMQANNLPRLIILDYNMAPLTGLDVLKGLKQSEKFAHIAVANLYKFKVPKA